MMQSVSPFNSREGVLYLCSLIQIVSSRNALEEAIHVISQEFEPRYLALPKASKSASRLKKKARKEDQVMGVCALVSQLGSYETILDVNCGNGLLTSALAAEFPQTALVGIDHNEELIARNKERYAQPNLHFTAHNAFTYEGSASGLVISLHGCGSLSDRVLDIALQHQVDVLVVPCCYGKLQSNGGFAFPRSTALSSYREQISKKIVNMATQLEGQAEDGRQNYLSLQRDLARMIINLDRALYLQEHGYSAFLAPITADHGYLNGRRFTNSSLRTAVVGQLKL